MKAASKQFIDYVEKQRGSKLKVPQDRRSKVIFDAKVFEGEEAVKLGLVDELGNISQVLALNYPECKLNIMGR
jgi:ClpP class serine protease